MENIIKKIKSTCARIAPSLFIKNGYAAQQVLVKRIKMLEEQYGSVTDERIVDYCVFVAHRYRNSPTPSFKQWFGVSAMNLFYKRKSGLAYYEDKWLEGAGLTRGDLIRAIKSYQHPQAKYVYLEAEETTKQRMLNQKVGFVICQTSTLGWSPLSETCQSCNFVADCKVQTQEKYPEIYRLREEYEQRQN